MVNLLPLGTSDIHCNFIVEKSQVWREWRPAVLNFTILYSCYLQNTINFILTTLWQITLCVFMIVSMR